MGSLTDKYQQLRKETEEKQRIEQEMQKQEAYYGNIINRTKFVCKEHWKTNVYEDISNASVYKSTLLSKFDPQRQALFQEAAKLIREDDEVVYGDSGYVGVQKRAEIKDDEHLSKIDYRITRRPSSLPKVSDNAIDWERYIDYRKSSVRSKVEHAFKIIKGTFGFSKVRYRGIDKNLHKLNVLFACANLLMFARAKNFSTVQIG